MLNENCLRTGFRTAIGLPTWRGHATLAVHVPCSHSASCSVAFPLASLVITKSHSRPQTSDDNPSSEAQFKTLKYRPDFPQRIASLEHARAFLRDFFHWYNTRHHHSALALLRRLAKINSPSYLHWRSTCDLTWI